MGVLDFLSPEARQGNRRWLDEQNAAIAEALRYYLGPTGTPDRLGMFADGTPSAGIDRAGAASTAMFQPGLSGWDRMARAGDMLSETAGAVTGLLGSPATVGMADDLAQEVAPTINRFMVDDFGGAKTLKPPMKGVDLPNLRDMPVDAAIRTARREPHLIESGGGSEGLYVGGPRSVQSRNDLLRIRRGIDDVVGFDPRGADWYDRYRQGVMDVTNGDPLATQWFTNREGQFSAGVAPSSELAFAIKDLNSAIATGSPVKAARPAQQAASARAIAANDPQKFQLGPKTGEYARLVDPNRGGTAVAGATGVNDFRHLRNLGYTETDGAAQKNAVGAAGHRFADYETALAVDRANKKQLGGRSDWTGERLQAAPWVTQKGRDFYKRQKKSYTAQANTMVPTLNKKTATADQIAARNQEVERRAFDLAMDDANSTIADYFPKHTAYATYEAQPFYDGGHLPGSAAAPYAERLAYAQDPRSAWDFAPNGRDAIYSGMQLGDTGYSMAVRPTVDMQGVYMPPGGAMEYNPGKVARPMVGFDSGKVKSLPKADDGLLTGGEATRALIDYQGAGAYNKPWLGGQSGKSNSIVLQRPEGRSTAMTPDEMTSMMDLGGRYGLPNIVDNGDSVLMHNFDGPKAMKMKGLLSLGEEVKSMGGFSGIDRAKVDGGYIGYEDAWTQGEGSGAAVNRFLATVDDLPRGTYDALNNNQMIKKAALDRADRDDAWASKWGVTRQDVQTMRRVIGEAKGGWIDALKQAVKAGVVLPAVAMAYVAAGQQGDG